MNRLQHNCVYWLSLLPIVVCAPALHAQVTVQLKIGGSQAFVNEAFQVAIEIANFQSSESPEFPEIAGCTVRQLGGASESSFVQIINGQRTESHTRTHTYELTPHAVGELVIPPIPVQVDGRVLTTRETKVQVRASDAEELLAVEIAAGRGRIYVGQRVQVTLSIWVKPARYGNQLLDADSMIRLVQPINVRPFEPPARVSQRRRAFGKTETTYYVYELTANFIADRTGPLSFDDVEIGLAYPVGSGYRNLRSHATVEPVEVLPIPMEGRPANFNGAVGLYSIEASASPASVRVGDPIELVLEVFGDGPVETLPPPLLSANRPMNDAFRVPDQILTGEMQNGRRRFTVTIRARRDDVTEIPPIEYPYFDPDAERFVVAASHAIPLTVTPAAQVEAPDLTPSTPQPGAGGTTLQALDGLHDIETSEVALLATPPSIAPSLVTGVIVVPPLVFMLTWTGLTLVRNRAADPARRRRHAALRIARRRIAGARPRPPRELAVEIVAAMAGYLADRTDEPPARFTGDTALDFLREQAVRAEIVEQWAAVITGCEEASFAGGTQTDGDALCRQALACLTALEREKL